MKGNVGRVIVRKAFEAVLDQMKEELYNDCFELGGVTDYQDHLNMLKSVTLGKYKVLSVYDPYLYKEMMRLSPEVGLVLPCLVSVAELYPGETAVTFYNPTEHIARDMKLYVLESLALKVSEKLRSTIQTFDSGFREANPDLVTSWS